METAPLPHCRRRRSLLPGCKQAQGLSLVSVAMLWLLAPVALAQPAAVPASPAGKPPAAVPAADDEKAIRAAAQAYMEALKRGDGKTLAEMWTAEGDIIDGEGNVLKGRETLGQTRLPAAGEPQPEFRFGPTQVRLIAADVALEDGTVEVTPPGSKQVNEGRFSAVWVKRGGQWRLEGLREWQVDRARGPEVLQELEWMVGDWEVIDNDTSTPASAAGATPGASEPAAGRSAGANHASGKGRMEISVRWNPQRTYLVRDLKILPHPGPVSPPGAEGQGAQETVGIVSQRIGWDPLSKQIHSWAFSADGGHGEAVWTREGDSWVARSTSVHPDGHLTSSMNIYTYDGQNECTWQSFQTHAGGELAAPITMTMVRKTGSPSR